MDSLFRNWPCRLLATALVMVPLSARAQSIKDPAQCAAAEKQAESGDTAAESTLAKIYKRGECNRGIPEMEKAITWYTKAAEQGNIKSENTLGNLYQLGGSGIRIDYKKATYWFEKAGAQGDPFAAYSLALLYDSGPPEIFDKKKSISWYIKSAEENYASSISMVAGFYKNPRLKELLPAVSDNGMGWLMKSADQGDTWAQLDLGEKYIQGDGVKADKVQAYKWLKLSAKERKFQDRANAALQQLTAGMSTQEIQAGDQLLSSWTPAQRAPRLNENAPD